MFNFSQTYNKHLEGYQREKNLKQQIKLAKSATIKTFIYMSCVSKTMYTWNYHSESLHYKKVGSLCCTPETNYKHHPYVRYNWKIKELFLKRKIITLRIYLDLWLYFKLQKHLSKKHCVKIYQIEEFMHIPKSMGLEINLYGIVF